MILLSITKQRGFSLIEIMVSVALIAILSLIAVMTYSHYMTKSRRSEAIYTLLSMQMAQERYRSNQAQYGNLQEVWGGVSKTDNGYYTLSISNLSATTYTLTATALGNQLKDAEDATSCSMLTLTVSDGNETKAPAACWAN